MLRKQEIVSLSESSIRIRQFPALLIIKHVFIITSLLYRRENWMQKGVLDSAK